MSTWTSSLAGLACLALAGCGDAIAVSRSAPDSVLVAGNSVVVAGPPGYCVDRSAMRDGRDGSFVLMGSCASIAQNARLPRPAVPAMATVTVSAASDAGLSFRDLAASLPAYFRSEAGRAALSRTGDPASVEVLETRLVDGALYIHARDAGASDGTSADYWRALLGVNDRLVTVSVVGFEAAPMSLDAALATLDGFADRIRAENRGGRSG